MPQDSKPNLSNSISDTEQSQAVAQPSAENGAAAGTLPPPSTPAVTDSGRIRFGAGFRLKPRG